MSDEEASRLESLRLLARDPEAEYWDRIERSEDHWKTLQRVASQIQERQRCEPTTS